MISVEFMKHKTRTRLWFARAIIYCLLMSGFAFSGAYSTTVQGRLSCVAGMVSVAVAALFDPMPEGD